MEDVLSRLGFNVRRFNLINVRCSGPLVQMFDEVLKLGLIALGLADDLMYFLAR